MGKGPVHLGRIQECKEVTRKAKALLELNLEKKVKNSKKGFF